MVKSNELRIGNYLHNPVQNINFKIDARVIISIESEEKRSEIYDKYSYKPIPLTEEMLLRCGAKFNGSDIIINNTLVIEEAMAGEYFYTCGLGVKLNDEPIKYLHQLQNLFYCLCSRELNIKL